MSCRAFEGRYGQLQLRGGCGGEGKGAEQGCVSSWVRVASERGRRIGTVWAAIDGDVLEAAGCPPTSQSGTQRRRPCHRPSNLRHCMLAASPRRRQLLQPIPPQPHHAGLMSRKKDPQDPQASRPVRPRRTQTRG